MRILVACEFSGIVRDAFAALVGVVGMIVLTVFLIPAAIMTTRPALGRSADTPDGGFANRLKYPSILSA